MDLLQPLPHIAGVAQALLAKDDARLFHRGLVERRGLLQQPLPLEGLAGLAELGTRPRLADHGKGQQRVQGAQVPQAAAERPLVHALGGLARALQEGDRVTRVLPPGAARARAGPGPARSLGRVPPPLQGQHQGVLLEEAHGDRLVLGDAPVGDRPQFPRAVLAQRLHHSVGRAGVLGAAGEAVECTAPARQPRAPVAEDADDAAEALPVDRPRELRVVLEKHAHHPLRVAQQRASRARLHGQQLLAARLGQPAEGRKCRQP
mmetsp:Transcript_58590/g.156850  ORF Transcript_58590/g.156850 Transcript_58590/m.156850 type:complete len:262 (-) Transcript_58590:364-1149(-)